MFYNHKRETICFHADVVNMRMLRTDLLVGEELGFIVNFFDGLDVGDAVIGLTLGIIDGAGVGLLDGDLLSSGLHCVGSQSGPHGPSGNSALTRTQASCSDLPNVDWTHSILEPQL
jgi:hypothetical protein